MLLVLRITPMLELYPLRRQGKLPAAVLNIAHRGARAFAPENTLAAFAKAKTFGCRMVELDVRLSLDGELMVHHDEQLTRCTDVQAKFPGRSNYIWDFTYAELSLLDAGSWYVDQLSLPGPQRQAFLQTLTDDEAARFISPQDREFYASGEIKLPTLRQVLVWAGRVGMMVNIELKTQPGRDMPSVEAVVRLVVAMGMAHQVLISSFDHQQLALVRQLSNTIATAVLTSDRLEHLNDYLQGLDADAYHPNCYSSDGGTLNLDDIAAVRAGGRTVNAWTCNKPDDMRQLIAAGVTGLISDYPNRVQEVLSVL
jgi:glycerophosphoryl diester phosphodiesterase